MSYRPSIKKSDNTTQDLPLDAETLQGKQPSDFVTQPDLEEVRKVADTAQQTANSKYEKPSTGIPNTDLAQDVKTSLGKADSAIQNVTASVGLTATKNGTSVDIKGTLASTTADGMMSKSDKTRLGSAIVVGDTILNNNNFGGKKIFLEQLSNAFYRADKRWNVTFKVYKVDGDEFVRDNPVSNLFDGRYFANGKVAEGEYGIIAFDFEKGSQHYFPGYPYGWFLLCFYDNWTPKEITARMYCNYESQGVGWHDLTGMQDLSTTPNCMIKAIRNNYYNMSRLEFKIVGQNLANGSSTGISEILFNLDRTDGSNATQYTPVVSKYEAETVYEPFSAPKFIENGVELEKKYLQQADIPSIGSANLEIYQNETLKGTFSANQSGNAIQVKLTDTTYNKASATLDGLMAKEDKDHVDKMWSIWGSSEDADKLVNTVTEVLKAFEDFQEGSTIVGLLANKQDKITSSNKLSYTLLSDTPDLSGYALKSSIPSWAMQPSKPTYSASEVEAVPVTSSSGSVTGTVTNASGAITIKSGSNTLTINSSSFTYNGKNIMDYQSLDNLPTIPSVPSWAMQATKPTYKYNEIINTSSEQAASTNYYFLGGDGSWKKISWSMITAKPSWIGSTKPSYSWDEIVSKPSWIGSAKPKYTLDEIVTISSEAAASTNYYFLGGDKVFKKISWSMITAKPSFATVATTGKYSDLIDKPDLSVYATTATMNSKLSAKQDAINANNKLSYLFLKDTPSIPSTAADVGALPLSGGTLTGNLTGKYITGTWLQTTTSGNLTTAATKYCVLDGSGWVYYRTPSQVLSDIDALAKTSGTATDLTIADVLTFSKGAYINANGTTLTLPSLSGTLALIGDVVTDYRKLNNLPDLSIFALQSDLQNYVTKTSFNSLNGTVTTIGNSVSKLGPQVTELDTKVSNLEKYRNPVWFKSNYVPLGAVSVDMTLTFEPESYSTLALSGGAMMNPTHANGNGIYAKEGDLIIFPRCACLAIGRVYGFSNSRIQVAIVVAQFFSNTCLEQGTLITMYDGTEKPIEEIKDGDILLSYDFEKQQHCPAVCLVNTQTTTNTVTDYLTFSNDTIIGVDVTASHEIYDATKGCFVSCKNELPIGDKVLDIDGNEVEFLGPVDWNSDGNTKGFYNIISSNNCYYANGILMAHHPYCKKSWTQRYRNIPLSDELNNILELDSIDMSKNSYQVRDVNVIKKMNKLRGQLIRSKVEMGNLIDNLTDTDYISQKASEGYKSEKITKILADREAWRADYNAREIKHKALQQEYDNLIASNSPLGKNALLSEMELRAKLFKEACKRDNENYALFNEYFGIKNN